MKLLKKQWPGKFQQRREQLGQASIEMALMLIVMVGVAITVRSAFQSNEYFANLVSGPWQSLSGLIQNGVWGDAKSKMANHPNNYSRFSTPEGDTAQ